MPVRYEDYRIFYYAAHCRSFTRAAALLGSNQPNVTRCMSRLERELGCTLFVRSRRGIALTPEGETLFSHVAAAQEQLQLAEETLAQSSALQGGVVSVSASETALNLFLLSRLKAFHTAYPHIRLRLSNHSTPQALAALQDGTADLAVVTTPTHAEKPLRETLLMPFAEILVGGPDFAPLARRPLSFAALAEQPLVCLGRDTMTYAFYSELFARHGLVLHPDTEAATADQLLPLIRCGLGLGFVPEGFAREALARGEVVQIPLAEPIPLRRISLLRDGRRPLGAAARALEQALCSAKKQAPQ